MAKPFIVASTDGASSSKPAPSHCPPHRHPPSKPRPRRRATATAAHSLAPSATLLSLLSVVASSSVAEGSPAPPAFLCPSVQAVPTPTKRRLKRDTTSTSPSPTVPSVPRTIVQNIPDKYEQGEDGIWRRVDSYTFYGVCTAGCSTTAVSAIDQGSANSSDTATAIDIDSTYDVIPDKLPPGWAPKPPTWGHEARTTLILAMSLVLAFFICFLIIGCLFWRKSMQRKYRERDLEMKGKARERSLELSNEEVRETTVAERGSRSKQKLWSRATARWRENVRYSARQRRGKRASIRSRTRRSSISLDNPRDGLTSGRSSSMASSSRTRTMLQRHSTCSLQHDSTPNTPTSQQEFAIPTISLSPASPAPPQSSPPAYRQKALQANLSSYASSQQTSTSHLVLSRRPSHTSFFAASESESGEISSIPAAHVATDDKAVLARLADLASAPPSDERTDASGHREVSAPEWRDEEMEDFIAQSDDVSNQTPAGPSPFPPPPSKGNLFAPNFYDYPYTFEEMELGGMEPELGPSAPPFEENPGAVLVGDEHDISLTPSAPPLLDDDDFYVDDPMPSAHPRGSWEGRDGEGSNSAGHGVTGELDSSVSNPFTSEGPALPDYRP